jgi:hypothetical protein
MLAYYIQDQSCPAFSKDDMEAQLRQLKRRFVKYEDYARATIKDLVDEEDLRSAEQFHAYTFSSSYLENNGQGRFELRPLPAIAQFAPMYGMVAEDFNGDGHLDLLMGETSSPPG